MPYSIYNINTKSYVFHSGAALQECIDAYFDYIGGEYELANVPSKKKGAAETVEEKVWIRPQEPPTIAGLAWYLGFASLDAFEQYEHGGRYRRRLKRARLRIAAEYEKKLHGSNSTGAIFALKNMGWGEKVNSTLPILNGTIKIEIINTGLQPGSAESEVSLSDN